MSSEHFCVTEETSKQLWLSFRRAVGVVKNALARSASSSFLLVSQHLLESASTVILGLWHGFSCLQTWSDPDGLAERFYLVNERRISERFSLRWVRDGFFVLQLDSMYGAFFAVSRIVLRMVGRRLFGFSFSWPVKTHIYLFVVRSVLVFIQHIHTQLFFFTCIAFNIIDMID